MMTRTPKRLPASDSMIAETVLDLGQRLKHMPDGKMTLSDVMGVAELLTSSLQPMLRRIDVTLHQELRGILQKIETMRSEISKVHAGDISAHRIPQVGRELGEIVAATEEATNSIMNAAERVLEADDLSETEFKALATDQMMLIFEACSFQDITGQRVNNVVQTIEVIEERINVLCTMMDAHSGDQAPVLTEAEKSRQSSLLNGPSGSGADQAAIDAMF